MFQKGTWTVLKIQADATSPVTPETSFLNAMQASGTTYVPILAISKAIHEQTTTIGLAPFSHPRLGDEEEYLIHHGTQEEILDPAAFRSLNLTDWTMEEQMLVSPGRDSSLRLSDYWISDMDYWRIQEGVYAMWLMAFEYIDAQDINSKKEALAYDFGAPFKLQSTEIKKQITDTVTDMNTFTRKHYQIVWDFNRGLIWLNTAGKPVLDHLLRLTEGFGLQVATPEFEAAEHNMINQLYLKSTIKEESVARLVAVKLHGPDGVEPHENATMEKILKAFCAFSEVQGYYVGLSTPAGILLNEHMPSVTAAKTNYEVTELMEGSDASQICEASLMITEYADKLMKNGEEKRIWIKRFSLNSPHQYHKELPGLILKGLNIEDFKQTVKQHVRATGEQPSIKDYWSLYFNAMNIAIGIYFNTLLKEMKDEAAGAE